MSGSLSSECEMRGWQADKSLLHECRMSEWNPSQEVCRCYSLFSRLEVCLALKVLRNSLRVQRLCDESEWKMDRRLICVLIELFIFEFDHLLHATSTYLRSVYPVR